MRAAEAKSGALFFSKRLLAPGLLALREKLTYLAQRNLDHNIYVDTLLGMHFDPEVGMPAAQTFLIFDFYRIFLYQNSTRSDGPMVNSVIRSLIDDYSVAPLKALADDEQNHFRFFYSVETLEILPLLWDRCRPETLVTLDLASLEIRTTIVFAHPECTEPQIEKSGLDCVVRRDGVPVLQDLSTGRSMRGKLSAKLDDLVSPDVGVIRQEGKYMGGLSFPMAITQIAAGSETIFTCGGRNVNMPTAMSAARCEAVERRLVNFFNPQDSFVYGSFETLQEVAIDPEALCFNLIRPSPSSLRARYEKSLSMYWSCAGNPLSGKAYLVPAQEIWFNTEKLPNENLCLLSSTNACAVGNSFEEAALFAILEAVERDAFLTTWYLRRPCDQVVPDSIRLEAFQHLWSRAQHKYRNYKILLFNITTDIAIPVILCAAVKQSGRGPQITLSTACRFHVEEAAFAALKELARLPDPDSFDDTHARKLLENPADVFGPEDHAAFYSLAETFGQLSFLGLDTQSGLAAQDLNQGLWIPRQNRYNLKPVLEEILERMDALEVTILLKDLTHHEFLQRNLYCVRAIAPGLYPMWFGYYGLRFRMSNRLSRLSRAFLGKPLEEISQVNLNIHPFD
ncbi:MAG TPA: YcaO-like family protein [Candidatus Angelobacter sp.]|nr:YcaO-like family protein [Candidatus Angelobacter sp.]